MTYDIEDEDGTPDETDPVGLMKLRVNAIDAHLMAIAAQVEGWQIAHAVKRVSDLLHDELTSLGL